MQDALSVPLDPPLPQEGKKIGRQHGVAIAATLTVFDAQDHAGGVDVSHLQGCDLGDTQARAVGDRESRQMLEADCRAEQATHLVRAQDIGQLARVMETHQLASEIGPVDRMNEEEAQRRDNGVNGRYAEAGLLLDDLEPAQVVGGLCVW